MQTRRTVEEIPLGLTAEPSISNATSHDDADRRPKSHHPYRRIDRVARGRSIFGAACSCDRWIFFYGGVPIFDPFDARLAYFGMSLFFVLSGFVIQYNYASVFLEEPLPSASFKFLVARFARLYPLYVISIIFWQKPNLAEYWGTLFAYTTLTQSWFNVQMAIFLPDWSISTEWFFYFAFIPLVFLVARIKRPLFVTALFLLAALSVLATIFYYAETPLIEFTRRWLWTDKLVSASPEEWLRYFSPFVRILEFFFGCHDCKNLFAIERSPTPAAANLGASRNANCRPMVSGRNTDPGRFRNSDFEEIDI